MHYEQTVRNRASGPLRQEALQSVGSWSDVATAAPADPVAALRPFSAGAGGVLGMAPASGLAVALAAGAYTRPLFSST